VSERRIRKEGRRKSENKVEKIMKTSSTLLTKPANIAVA
jgi:hypothetical protein